MAEKQLAEQIEIKVRFSEVDSMGVVWHGNYVHYFEDGREAFGRKYGLSYMDFYEIGLLIPTVKMNLNYRKPLRFGEKAIVEIKYIDSDAALIRFDYNIISTAQNEILTSGSTTQAFVDTKGELKLVSPPFYEEWKKRHGLR